MANAPVELHDALAAITVACNLIDDNAETMRRFLAETHAAEDSGARVIRALCAPLFRAALDFSAAIEAQKHAAAQALKKVAADG